ncbi:MAG TPA: SRPBCC family protein [Thermoplasmata archaeon]|nr:SRPBCC family protein [Thermoplasmata archaeon]
MLQYEEEEVFPAPPEKLWQLLRIHLDDARIGQIHKLILSQKTVRQSGDETVVDRTIDARGKHLRSSWKYTVRAPEFFRWEVVDGDGPWTPGSFIESRYAAAPGGTRITSRGELKIKVLPFIIPQRGIILGVLGDIENEDVAFARNL